MNSSSRGSVIKPWHLTPGEAEIREQRVREAPLQDLLAARREHVLEQRRQRVRYWPGRSPDRDYVL